MLIASTIIETGIDVPSANTIIIEHHDFVDMKRVVTVGTDAYSIKDIIRLVQQQNDSAETEKLKAIIRRADITDAKKLDLANRQFL